MKFAKTRLEKYVRTTCLLEIVAPNPTWGGANWIGVKLVGANENQSNHSGCEHSRDRSITPLR